MDEAFLAARGESSPNIYGENIYGGLGGIQGFGEVGGLEPLPPSLLAAVYLINRVPSKVLDNFTPLERLFEQKPDYNSLRTFGCAGWPHLRLYDTCKVEFRSNRCVFLGIGDMHKGFKCFGVSSGRVYVSRDVIFDENLYPFSTLHANAVARLRSKIINLSPSLLNLGFGKEPVADHVTNDCNTLFL